MLSANPRDRSITRARRAGMVGFVVLATTLWLAACGGGGSSTASPTSPSGAAPAGTAPALRTTHEGWKNPRCNNCHALPVSRHQIADVWRCAECHGANGACNPNGRSTVRRHASTDICVNCHQQKHQFTANTQCVGCHFASAGLVTCPGAAGPTLPVQLQSGCFGWPAAEFSPANSAGVATFLRAGQQAVDFTLRDTSGVAVRLSDLLRTRPVLLVHGSFT